MSTFEAQKRKQEKVYPPRRGRGRWCPPPPGKSSSSRHFGVAVARDKAQNRRVVTGKQFRRRVSTYPSTSEIFPSIGSRKSRSSSTRWSSISVADKP